MTINDFAEMYMHHVDLRTKKAAVEEVKAFITAFKEALLNEERLQLATLGTFDMKIFDVPAGERYNPVKGEKEKYKKHRTIRAHFKPSKELKEQFFLTQD